MRKAAFFGAVLVGAAVVAPLRLGADAAAPPAAAKKEYFACRFAITEPKDGARRTLAEPIITAEDGQLAEFLAGEEMPIDLGTAGETLTLGTEARLRVHRVSPDKFRVDLYVGHSVRDGVDPSDITVRQVGTRVVKEMTASVPFTFDLPGNRRVTATVMPVEVVK